MLPCPLGCGEFGLRSEWRVARWRGRQSVATKPWSSTAPPAEFRPFVDAGENLREFSLRAVVLGALFGILFGAVSVYVGLRAE